MSDKLTKAVRKARRVGIANKIEGIKAIRTAYPEPGLFKAKQFFELVTGAWSHIAAVNMEALWCVEHWGDRLECDCAIGEQVMATALNDTVLTSGQLMTAVNIINKVDAEKLATKNNPAMSVEKNWYVPGGIFPDQETANYWQTEFKRDPFNWHRRLLAAAGVAR